MLVSGTVSSPSHRPCLLLFVTVIVLFFRCAHSTENATGSGQFCANDNTKLPQGIKLVQQDHKLFVNMSQILPGENGSVSFVAMTSDANKQNFTIRVEYSRTELQEFIEKGNSSTQLEKLSCKEFSEKRMDLGGESCTIGEEDENCDAANVTCTTTFNVICSYGTAPVGGEFGGAHTYLVTLSKHPHFDRQPCRWVATFNGIRVLVNQTDNEGIPLGECLNATTSVPPTTSATTSTSTPPSPSGTDGANATTTSPPVTTLGGCLLTWLSILLIVLMAIQIILVVALVIVILRMRSRHKREQSKQRRKDEEKEQKDQQKPSKDPKTESSQTETSKKSEGGPKDKDGLPEEKTWIAPVLQSYMVAAPEVPPVEKESKPELAVDEVTAGDDDVYKGKMPDELQTHMVTARKKDGGDGPGPAPGETYVELMGEEDKKKAAADADVSSGTLRGAPPPKTDGGGGETKNADYERFESLSLSMRQGGGGNNDANKENKPGTEYEVLETV